MTIAEEEGLFLKAKVRAKTTLFKEIAEHPLMVGCSELDEKSLLALFGGFWPFVNGFPAVIEESYTNMGRFAPVAGPEKRLIERIGRMLAGSKQLAAVAKDESEHKALWLLSARQASFSKNDLEEFQCPHSSHRLTGDIMERNNIIDVLLDFASVEFVAEGISRTLMDSEGFRGLMGEKGKRWFSEHFVATHEGTPHEDIALDFARQMYPIINGDGAVLTDDDVAEKTISSGRRFIDCATDLVAGIKN